jgi:TonB family protein
VAPPERFGRLVLLGETRAGALGREYRAVRLSPEGFDRFVSVLRLSPAVSSHAEAARRLVEEARLFARPQHSGFARVLGVGRVEQSVYVSSELVEGRSLEAVLARCRDEGFPFAAEHGLMVASRVATALDSLHAKKDEAGAALVHGLLTPSRILVSWDGEVKVQGLGLWRALRADGLLPEEERRYLSPEQAAGGEGTPACDVYALCLVLREALAGLPPDGSDPVEGLREARLTTSGGQRVPLAPALADLLRQGLAHDPASRLRRMGELSRALDALLFSGEFTPTTFDLAFLMHTLFRGEMERETRELEEARRADYRALLPERPAERAPGPQTEPFAAATEVAPPTLAEAALPTEAPRPPSPPAVGPDASGARPAAARASREAAARQAASRMTLGAAASPPPARRGLWLALGLLLAVLVGGGGGYLYFVSRRSAPPPGPSAAADASQTRIRELEERIAQLEREKAEAEARAADDARQTIEAEAAAGGTVADPSAVAQAQEDARRRARAEQERRQEEERRRLEEERKAEEARLAEATPPPAAEPPPTPEPVPVPAGSEPPPVEDPAPPSTTIPPGPAPARPGSLVDFADPRLTPPVILRKRMPEYPEIARLVRASGVVELRALVDESGRVVDVTIVRSTRPGVRFEEAAARAVRGWLYRPATKDGVPVRVWVPVEVRFAP